jgi:phosphate-selective porin
MCTQFVQCEFGILQSRMQFTFWRGPSVTSPWSLGGGTGAWSVTARYSNLNLTWNEGPAGTACTQFVACIRGGELEIVNLDLTWYLSAKIKMMAEYPMVEIDR